MASMASEREVRIWLTRFSEILSTNEIGADNLLDLTFGDRVGIQWAEGTEHLAKKTFEELYGMLGLEKTMRIPGMVEEVDSLGVVNRWDDPEAWQETSKMPFALSWFQVTGIVRMVEIAFKHSSVLIGDEVGMGKTLESIGFFLTLQYFRQYYSAHGDFPGIWSKQYRYPLL